MNFNSTIKQKTGLCPDCDHEISQNLIAGRCPRHYKIHRHKINEEKKKTREVRTQAINKTIKSNNRTTDLVLWFMDKMANSEPVCENCGYPINKFNQQEWHGSMAHITQKAHIKSVATHPNNHMVLCRYGNFCHAKFDSSHEAASKMLVAKIAKERFKTFEHLIAPEERRRIPEWLLND